ncbi:unnamed protein product [Ilex paraguariensis]|uniref:Uncharacterized protein n=1 Tax=Ilex paraguariensis TaxID=185542 RepID=A0ABC8SPJ6_9AQUA
MDMTQQVASITCSHRGLKTFQSRPVGALERKNLHRSRCEQQEPLDEERPTNTSQGEERIQDPETRRGEGHEERERRMGGQSNETPGSRRLTTPITVISNKEGMEIDQP